MPSDKNIKSVINEDIMQIIAIKILVYIKLLTVFDDEPDVCTCSPIGKQITNNINETKNVTTKNVIFHFILIIRLARIRKVFRLARNRQPSFSFSYL